MRIVVAAWVLVLAVSCGGGDDPGKAMPEPESGAGGEPGAGGSPSESGGASGSMTLPEQAGAGASTVGEAGAGGAGGAGGSGDSLLPDVPDNGTLSGTRLKAEWYDFDGTRVFADFYDSELETVCLPGAWSDGKQYCIPLSTADLGYSDKECSSMLGHITFDRTCKRPSPRYVVVPTEMPGCTASSAHVYKLADAPTALTEYYGGQNGCGGPFSTGFNSDTFEVTGEVQASDLVEFTREAPADPGRLSRQYVVGADGSRLAIAPHDSESDADCSLKADGVDPSGGSCPPSDSKDVIFYTDADCKDGVASAVNGCKPAFARQLDDRACALGSSTYRAVGDVLKPDSVFVGGADVCRSTKPSGGTVLYELGKTLAPVTLTRAHEDIAGRNLQPIYFSDGEKRFLDQLLYDKEHDTECQVNVLRDGTIVCVPYGMGAIAFYDETCTDFVRVGALYYGDDECAHPAVPHFMTSPYVEAGGDCSAGYEIRELGEPYTGTPKLKGDTCDVYTGLEQDHFYQMGGVRPFSDFPTAKLTRDK